MCFPHHIIVTFAIRDSKTTTTKIIEERKKNQNRTTTNDKLNWKTGKIENI